LLSLPLACLLTGAGRGSRIGANEISVKFCGG